MTTALAAIDQAWWDGLRPEALLSVSRWSDEFRVIDGKGAAEPGRWNTDRTPYLREIMDRLGPEDPCEVVSVMAASQTGKSELIINWFGFTVDHSPAPMLIVQPTLTAAKVFSRQRLAPTIAASPRLKRKVRAPRTREGGNATLSKDFDGGIAILAGANSPSGLSSMPIRRTACDEVDRYDASAGTEGDPLDLAEQRTASFSTSRKCLRTSTPGILGASRIHTAYLEGDQCQFWVPCPHCEVMQLLVWDQVRWAPGDPEGAWYECPHCGCSIQDRQKDWMLPRGEWRADNPQASSRVHSYYLSGLCSPHRLGWSWGEIARKRVNAEGNPERMKVWRNTCLGLPFDEVEGTALSDAELERRTEDFAAPCPAGVAVLTAGVDVQDDRLEIEVVGWGLGEESWSVEYIILPGDPSGPGLWKQLDAVLARTWAHETHAPLRILDVCVDSGGHHSQQVHSYCAARAARRVWSVKGVGGHQPIFPRRPSRAFKGKWLLYLVGTWAAKDQVVKRLANDRAGPGYCHIPRGRDSEWFKQVTAERKVVGRRGRIEWVRTRTRNEALDCRCYAYAGLHSLYLSMGGRPEEAMQRAIDQRQPRPEGDGEPPRPPAPRRPAGHMSKYRGGGKG